MIQIKNSSGTIVATASVSFTSAEAIGLWKQASFSGIALAAGTYTVELVIPNYANVDLASVRFTPSLVATSNSVSGINGYIGGAAVVNAFTGDTVVGVAASSSNATLTVAAGSSVRPA
jgi:hypothetical protein